MTKPILLVTGANGFVGQHFVQFLTSNNVCFYRLSRDKTIQQDREVTLDSLSGISIDVVLHLAGRAHVLKEVAGNPETEFKAANVDFTMAVAKAAVDAGIKRFVFVSSVGVYGAYSSDTPITEMMPTEPKELYAKSKLEAEIKLGQYLSANGVELVILRPALIYGDNAPGNLAKLFKLCASSLPLPFKNATAKRTMLDVGSFCEAMLLCAIKNEAAGKVYNVADNVGVATTEIVGCFKSRLGKKNIQIPLPLWLLKGLLAFLNKQKMYMQLFESFALDSSRLQNELGWKPAKNPVFLLKNITLSDEVKHAKN